MTDADIDTSSDSTEPGARGIGGLKVAFLVANEGVEEVEMTEPWKAVEDAGATPVLVAPRSGRVQTMSHLDKSGSYDVDAAVGDVDPADYDALVLPGGVANPDQLRTEEAAVSFARRFVQSGKPVAAICHAPWTLVEAGVLDGRTVTSWPSLQTDIRNAGGRWVDEEVHTDGNLITSRKPDDLGAFCDALIDSISAGSGSPERR